MVPMRALSASLALGLVLLSGGSRTLFSPAFTARVQVAPASIQSPVTYQPLRTENYPGSVTEGSPGALLATLGISAAVVGGVVGYAKKHATLSVSGRPLDDETPAFVENGIEFIIFAMRLGTCALMVHHGIDKIQHIDGFSANVVAKFFGFLPGPPQFWTVSAAATQIAGAGLLGLGVLSRPVAASMSATMIVAVIFHLLNTGGEAFPLGVPTAHSYNFELAAMYVLVLSYFTVAGAGKISVDEQVLGGELNFYKKKFNEITGGDER